VVAQRSRAPDS